MADTVVVASLPSGIGKLILELYHSDGTFVNAPGDTSFEDVARPGRYSWIVSEPLSGGYEAIVKNVEGRKIGGFGVLLQDDTETYYLAELGQIKSPADVDGFTVAEALRVLLAEAVGNGINMDKNNPVFYAVGGTKPRVLAMGADGRQRTVFVDASAGKDT